MGEVKANSDLRNMPNHSTEILAAFFFASKSFPLTRRFRGRKMEQNSNTMPFRLDNTSVKRFRTLNWVRAQQT